MTRAFGTIPSNEAGWPDGPPGGGYTDEQAQDAVGSILVDTATIDFTYDDATPQITADVKNDAITHAKYQNIASDRLLGRDTASSGDPEELTVGGGIEFTGSGSIQTSAFTGDVTKSAGGTAQTIPNDTVTYAKMQNVSATDTLLGRATAGAGDVEEIACTSAGRALLDDASAAAQLTTLGAKASADLAVARTTAQRTTTSTTLGNITDLSFSIAASVIWSFECYLACGCSGTGGSQYAVDVPSGATLRIQFFGNTSSATAFTAGVATTDDGVSPTFTNANAQNRMVFVRGVVVNGVTAGTVQMRFKSVTSGQTTTVDTNSYLVARKH